MSTGLIVAIVVVALILVALFVLMPRMRRKAEERRTARELGRRRDRVATDHREHASTRAAEAERAERKARMAQQEAERERAEAQRLEASAEMHERGLADDQLIEDHERDRFAPVAGTDADPDDADRRPEDAYEQGRADEGRFARGEDAPVADRRETR